MRYHTSERQNSRIKERLTRSISNRRLPSKIGVRIALAFILMTSMTISSLPWNAAGYTKQKGPIFIRGTSSYSGNISYFANLDRTSGRNYHRNGHAYIIEHAIRLLREDGYPNWADFAQAYLLDLASGAVHADAYKGRVKIRVQLEVLWGLISKDLFEWDLTCAGGCEHYHNISDGSGIDLTGYSIMSKAADYLIKLLTIYASWYSMGTGLVNLDIEVDPNINFAYPSGADLCAQHYLNALETWRDGKFDYPGRSSRESAMYELGWACHLLADLTVAQHLYEKFIGGHADYENFADGKGDDMNLHAVKGDFNKNFSSGISSPRQLAEEVARAIKLQHPENYDQAEDGGDYERTEALKVALPVAERYTAALLARFMTEVGVPKTVPPLRGYVSVKGSADKVPGAYVYYTPINPIEQNVDIIDVWQGWNHVRADSQGLYSIPMTGNMKYLIRPVMPGYSFDGTTDYNLEFGQKTCPVEYLQASGVVDTDMLNLYMDPLPQATRTAVIWRPVLKQAVIAAQAFPAFLVEDRVDIIPAGAQLTLSGTSVSESLATAVTKSLMEVECSENVIGVNGNDINLPSETALNIHVFNYLDLSSGQVVKSAADVRGTVDRFRSKWRSAGLPLTASGDPLTVLTGRENLRPLDVTSQNALLAMKSNLSTRQDTAPGGASRNIISFVPPFADASQTSILMENGLAIVPSAGGVEIEVSTMPGPGCLQAPSSINLTTNNDGRAALRVKSGSHAGRVRLRFRIVKNPAAPQILPSKTMEISVQPRLQGVDPMSESRVQLEPISLMSMIQATFLTSGPERDVFRTKIQVGPNGISHGNADLTVTFKPAGRTTSITPPGRAFEKIPPDKVARTQVPDISGTWKSSLGVVYEITQNGNTFTWYATKLNQKAEGTITKNSVQASWRGFFGRDSATGKIIFDASGRAVRIEWSNKVVFTR